ncbi:RagB/SusD family nutrient uptake outer membrane protein [Chitinophaga sp. MM2321]|uniref:RagB/SusD family nutrient uptake outer membrane protein n=1 Tax=Chitinophaga sp. MM2321 TaxID=3137178 RepID=UPI0032D58BD5
MKKFFPYKLSLVLIVLIATCISSCEKMLEENPKSFLNPNAFFVDDVSLKTGITGAYAITQSLYTNNMATIIAGVGTDIETSTGGAGQRQDLDTYASTGLTSVFRTYWADNYILVQRACAMIERAPDVSGASEGVKRRVVAEAKFLRALAYLNLVRAFGEVPLVVKETVSPDFDLPRAPIKDVYARILADLDDALEEGALLKVKDVAEPGRANYWAVKALKGRALVSMAAYKESAKIPGYAQIDQTVQSLYEQARDVLKDVIDAGVYDLEPLYTDVFSIDKKNSNVESIWDVQFSVDPYGSSWSKDFYGLQGTGKKPTNTFRFFASIGQSAIKPAPSFYYFFKDGDSRREINVPTYTIDFTNNVPTSKKSFDIKVAMDPNETKAAPIWTLMGTAKYQWGAWNAEMPFLFSQCPNNINIIRFADVLLMYAEAALKANGGLAPESAVDAANRVVKRARGLDAGGKVIPASATPNFPNYTTATLTFDEILQERARELCFEHIRWYDLVRTGLLKVKVEARYTPKVKVTIDESMDYLYPVPSVEIDVTTNTAGFKQNPGY